MKQNLLTVIIRMALIGVAVSDHIKVHYQFYTMFMLMHEEIILLNEIYLNGFLRFLYALDHLQNHWASVDYTETTIQWVPTLIITIQKEAFFLD